MLVVANLLEDRDAIIEQLTKMGVSFDEARDAFKDMDFTTESITLATASFDLLPPEQQVAIKRSIERFIVPMAQTLLLAYQVSLVKANSEPIKILADAFRNAFKKIEKKFMDTD